MDYNITYRQKDKGWQYIISYKDSAGKWKQKSKQGFKSKKEAKPHAENALKLLQENQSLNTDYTGITFKEFTEMYLDHISLHFEGNTIRLYIMALKKFETLNNLEMNKITTIQIQKCIDKMIKEDLSYGTINTYLKKIKTIFNSAKNKYKIILDTPVENIEIKIKKEPSKKKALSNNDLKILLSKTTNIKYKVIFCLAGMCGLRFGEILGLKWNKINFTENTIKIDLQWKNLSNNNVGFGELKSKNSYRTVPMPPYVRKTLLEWKSLNPINISNRVIVYNACNGLNTLLSNYIRKLGYDLSLHELRHTYATNLIAKGIDFKTVAKLMGHDIEETMKIYSHVTDDMMNNATNLINSMF